MSINPNCINDGNWPAVHALQQECTIGIRNIVLAKNQVALMATLEKALFDKIITTSGILFRSTKQVKELLIDDLRIEERALKNLDTEEISKWLKDAPKESSIQMFIKTLKMYD